MSEKVIYVKEPELEFGYGQQMKYPRDGLYLYGPKEGGEERTTIRYGAIGTRPGIERLHKWCERVTRFIEKGEPARGAKREQIHQVPFPGFEEVYKIGWATRAVEKIDDLTDIEIEATMRIGNRHEAVNKAVTLYVDRLIRRESQIENSPDFWFVVIPEAVYQLGRPESIVPRTERISGDVAITARQFGNLKGQKSLFEEENERNQVYEYENNFRRQLKARLLEHKIVVQIVRESTLTPEDFNRKLEDAATVAWKLSTTIYYKSGRIPWQLVGVRRGVCYIGLVYKRHEKHRTPNYACCAAQMFLTNGEGVVFRGALGPWYSPDRKEYHLDKENASALLRQVLEGYEEQEGEPPKEVFFHAKSRFGNEEWEGFEEACPEGIKLGGIQIRDAREEIKLFRAGKYPVIRGTAICSERSAFLWTAGYVPRLATYMGPETPNPIQVRIHRGEFELEQVLEDVMGLTKINFNSCLYNDRLPVTLKFADAVGDILVAGPTTGIPKLPFKYYI